MGASLIKKEVRLVDMVKVCPYGKRSLERWLTTYRNDGEVFLNQNQQNQRLSRTKHRYELRNE